MGENNFIHIESVCLVSNTEQIEMQQHLGGERHRGYSTQVVEMLKFRCIN